MPEPLCYLNGQLLPQSDASLRFHDAGFVFGATATDLCRTFRHRLFRLADHLARFRQSCRLLRVSQPRTDEELTRIAEQLVAQNAALLAPEQDLALVLFATPGPIGYYAGEEGGPGQASPTLGMHTFPLPLRRYRHFFQQGARLRIPSTRRVPPACVDPRAKQRSRASWWLAEQEVHDLDPQASALLLDPEGRVTETSAANILLVAEGRVLSPRRQHILGGISLQVTEELCRALGLELQETDLRPEDCYRAAEAFLTSTPYCIAPVRQIDDAPIPCPGPTFQRLLGAWCDQVGLDIGAQILGESSFNPTPA